MNQFYYIQLWERNRTVVLIALSVCLILFYYAMQEPWEEGSYSSTLMLPQHFYFSKRWAKKTAPRAFPRTSKGEAECRRVLETMFRRPFPNVRPSALQNSVTQQRLELDCYNSELRLAVEYNGVQHYEYKPAFHSSRDAFYNQQYRDEMKKTFCRENSIDLIIVPHWIALPNIESFLTEKVAAIPRFRDLRA